jgi:hypothetical protein
MQQLQNFKPSDFDENGYANDGSLFTDLIVKWEQEFHQQFKPFYANYLFGNFGTMRLIQNCFDEEELERFGMDGDYDLETNLEVDAARKDHVPIVYALGSDLPDNKGEPVYLMEDSTLFDGVVLFKYVPDDDNEEGDDNPDQLDELLIEIENEQKER